MKQFEEVGQVHPISSFLASLSVAATDVERRQGLLSLAGLCLVWIESWAALVLVKHCYHDVFAIEELSMLIVGPKIQPAARPRMADAMGSGVPSYLGTTQPIPRVTESWSSAHAAACSVGSDVGTHEIGRALEA